MSELTAILLGIVTLVACGLIYFFSRQSQKYKEELQELRASKNEVIEKNKLAEAYNKNLLEETQKLTSILENQKQALKSYETIEKEEIEKELDEFYEERLAAKSQDFTLAVAELETTVAAHKAELQKLEELQKAYLEDKLREEKKQSQLDFYKMNLTETQINDVKAISQLYSLLFNKEALDKLIWEVYYKPEYNKMIARIFGVNTSNRCGIYKITNTITDKSYIGQSVNISDRWKSHIRNGIAYTPSNNKLYSDMQKYKPENYTFEVLEEVPRESLDEREKYWINFYKTNTWGLNTTGGNG